LRSKSLVLNQDISPKLMSDMAIAHLALLQAHAELSGVAN
jgi:hypothetical protein